MVGFTNGKKDRNRTRLFDLSKSRASDDYEAMKIMITRRLKKAKEEKDLPDLIIVDGGKGQLSIASSILNELDIASTDLICLTKEKSRHDKGLTQEKVFLPQQKEPIVLGINSKILFFLQRVRDESHRVAIGFHKKRRSKRLIKSSLLDIEGIGKVKSDRLLKYFGSVAQIKKATEAELQEVSGITKTDIDNLKSLD